MTIPMTNITASIFDAGRVASAHLDTRPEVVQALAALTAAANKYQGHTATVAATYYCAGQYQDPTDANATMETLIRDCDAAYLMALTGAVLGQDAPTAQKIVRAWTTVNKGVSAYVGLKGNDSYLSMMTEGCGLVMAMSLLTWQAGSWSASDRAAADAWLRTVYTPTAESIIGPQRMTNNWLSWALHGLALAAAHLGDTGLRDAVAKQLDTHIVTAIDKSTGHLPEEDSRAVRAVNYTAFSLIPMLGAAAIIATNGGPNLLVTHQGLIRLALDTLLARLDPLEAGQKPASNNAADLYEAMGVLYRQPKYTAYAARHRPVLTVGQHLSYFTCPLVTLPLQPDRRKAERRRGDRRESGERRKRETREVARRFVVHP